MASDTHSALPDIGEVVGRILQGVPRERQPLLIAIAERLAAERYRGWAADAANAHRKAELLACAGREDEIADRIEGLFPDAAAIQSELRTAHPDFAAINRALFGGRPMEQQFAIQARGERLGAATWRSFARHQQDPAARDTFLACAVLEEDSAAVLESFLGPRRDAS